MLAGAGEAAQEERGVRGQAADDHAVTGDHVADVAHRAASAGVLAWEAPLSPLAVVTLRALRTTPLLTDSSRASSARASWKRRISSQVHASVKAASIPTRASTNCR